jgi:hypothetical protein
MDADIHSLGTTLANHRAQEFTRGRETAVVMDAIRVGYELLNQKKGWMVSDDEDTEDVDPELDEAVVESADLVI